MRDKRKVIFSAKRVWDNLGCPFFLYCQYIQAKAGLSATPLIIKR